MDQTLCSLAASIEFWDGYAQWYKLWIQHNNYHDKIIAVLSSIVKPGWRVLDIGAGNGVLSLPLCAMGCDVTAIEPSRGMRSLLFEETVKRDIDWIKVDERKWKDVSQHQLDGYDLIMACNTLHLTQAGFTGALKKIFQAKPKNVFVVTELGMPGMNVRWQYGNYTMLFTKSYETESSFAYHHIEEVFEHWTFINGCELYPDEDIEIRSKIVLKDSHLWRKDIACVGMYWWRDGKNKK